MTDTRGFDPPLWKELSANVELVGIDVPSAGTGMVTDRSSWAWCWRRWAARCSARPTSAPPSSRRTAWSRRGTWTRLAGTCRSFLTGELTATVAFGERLGRWVDPVGGARATRSAPARGAGVFELSPAD